MVSATIRGLCLAAVLALAACDGSPDHAGAATDAATAANAVSSLDSVDLKSGEGAAIAPGQTAVVQYTGWLYESAAPDHKGRQFDSSVGREPFRFKVGAGDVIAGWDQGIVGMRVGGRRRLTIPASLAYGAEGAGGGAIPGGATLLFDLELVGIEPAPGS